MAELTSKGLLSKEPLSGAVELLDELAWQEPGVEYLNPAANAILLKTELQNLRFFLGPSRRGGEVPSETN
eukprot:scaffold443639_cov42-Prasinocladus_malaysianus.AAC.1